MSKIHGSFIPRPPGVYYSILAGGGGDEVLWVYKIVNSLREESFLRE